VRTTVNPDRSTRSIKRSVTPLVAAVVVVLGVLSPIVAATSPADASLLGVRKAAAPPTRHLDVKGKSALLTAEKQTRSTSKATNRSAVFDATAPSGAENPNAFGVQNPDGTWSETTGGAANTWTNYSNAGGSQGPTIPGFNTIEVQCWVSGFGVANGNTYWYQIAQAPWSFNYYVSADPFYNNGATSGPLHGTPFVDPHVPQCGGGNAETAGGSANTWTNYTNAGGSQGPSIGGGQTVQVACAIQGFKVADGNVWWYRIAQSPWNNQYYVSADAFYNNGQTSGSLIGTPFVDPHVAVCSGPTGNPGSNETAGGAANTWSNYTNAGGSQGQTIAGGQTVGIACAVQGFKVQDGNTWWYRIASSPWNGAFYVSADAFYNNGQTSGSLVGTPFVDPAIPYCPGGTQPPNPGNNETAGGAANTWTDYTSAGGTQGQTIAGGQTVAIACKIQGFRVADGNTYWYKIASSPWNGAYFVSADAFYNNGATSGSLLGTPFYDPAVPDCTAPSSGTPDPSTTPPGGANETAGGVAHTWTNYSNAGGTQGPDISGGQAVLISCKLTGFAVADGNNWWYQVGSSPWNGSFYVSADAFYNNGHTSGTLIGTPYVDYNVPDCSTQGGSGSSPTTGHPSGETTGGSANTFGNYSEAGAPGPHSIPQGATVQVSCRVQGFRVQDGNTWWYLVASSPWNNVWYVSADPFYNNGATSGSLKGTPFYDPNVPICVNNTETPLYSSSYGSSHSTTNRTSCGAADPVDCASGNFSHTFTDVSLAGRGPGIDLTRTYNSLNPTSGGLFGVGWSSMYDQSLNTDSPTRAGDGSIVINLEDGSQLTATPSADGYVTPSQTDTTFAQNANGTYTLVRHEQSIETFSASGQLLSIGDLNGYKTTLTYNSSNRLSAITDSSGRTVLVTVGTNGLVSSVKDPKGRTTHYTYNAFGDLISTTDPLGRSWQFTYDSNNRMLTMTDPRGGVVTNAYDSEGRATSQEDAAGLTTTFAYTGDNFGPVGGTTTITDPHGNVRVELYANGFLAQVIKAYGTSLQGTWSYQYDPLTYGQTQITDPNGNVTTNTYDTHGHVLTSTDPMGATTTYTYNGLEEITSVQTPLGETSLKTYDASGNLLTSTDPLGGSTTYIYGDSSHPGDLTAVTDPDGRTTSYTYDQYGDAASKTTMSSSGVTESATSVYDADGEVVCQASPNATALGITCPATGSSRVVGTYTYVYDADGEQKVVTNPKGGTTTTVFDPDGNPASVTNPDSHVTLTTYDPDNRKLKVTVGSDGGTPSTTSYAYDIDPGTGGCQTVTGTTYCQSSTDGNGNVTVDYFDALGDQIEEQRPAGITTSYGYDLDGNRTSTTDAAGRVTTFGYDKDNRLTSVAYSDGTTPNVTYSYDGDGHRKTMTDGTGATSYSYDPDGRTTSVTNGAGAVVSYGYDHSGDVTSIGYPNGQTVTRGYDGADRLITVTDWLGHTTAYGYDADGNVTTTTYPNGDVSTSTFDSNDAVSGTSVASSGTVLLGLADKRDGAGQLLSETRTGAETGTTSYSYNANSQLVQAAGSSYAYDNAGNLTQSPSNTESYNTADELTGSVSTTGPTAYSYDPVGDLTSVTGSTGAGTTYGYNQVGQMTAATQQVAPLQVSGLAPTSGPAKGGTSVTITGTGFTGATKVTFGPLVATKFTVVSDSQIVVTSPGQAGGIADVTVTTPFGTSATSPADQFTYVAPKVTGLSPNTGTTAGGVPVTISGSNFTGVSSVKFGGTLVPFTFVSDTQIMVTSPAHGLGTVDVTVATPSGTSAVGGFDQFTFGHMPTINSLGPTAGTTAGGNTVTIWGANLTGTTAVNFGPVGATSFQVVSASKLTAIVPPEAAGQVPVTVTTPYGTSSVVSGSHYSYAAAPTLTGLSPNSGSTAGGTTVTIAGSGFTGATRATFGAGAFAAITAVSDGQLTVVTPAHSAGSVNVVVTTPGGHNGTVAAGEYTFVTTAGSASRRSSFLGGSELPAASTTPNPLAAYEYNGDGLRMLETTTTGSLAFVWDPTTSVPEVLTDGTHYFIYGASGQPVEQLDASNTPSYFVHDGIGSTRALLTTTGSVGATFTYSAYGKVTQTGSLSTPLQFAQSYSDPATGLDYLINRNYDPSTGGFDSVDPALEATLTPYAYANGNPVSEVDPSGAFPWGDVISAVIDHNPVVSVIHGGVTALSGYASATGTCFAYGWGSNQCSNATWSATVGGLEFGLNTITVGLLNTVLGVAEDYYNGHAWVPYPTTSGSGNGGSASSQSSAAPRSQSGGSSGRAC
jgi:RHS repeat-associated protein